jgi:membrane protease YdiL (CAAX protease family)
MNTGIFEEAVFRGVVLYSFLRLWGNEKHGVFKSVIYCSALFGLVHIDRYVAYGGYIDDTIFRVLSTFLAGIFYGALLLHGKSIWIPIVCHSAGNILHADIVYYMNPDMFHNPGPILWICPHLATLAMGLYGLYLIRKAPLRQVVPNAS